MADTSFFQRQSQARRKTGVLVLLFLAAVGFIALAVCLAVYLVIRSQTSASLPFHHWLLSSYGLWTAAAVILVIVLGSIHRWVDLAGGGDRVAKMVGARPVSPDTRNGNERTLRNVVEEMAIASGVPVPELYVMDEETGINAFVAGYSPGEAVMVVTNGAVTELSRDELQGVVAHEFSHIFNGDMRLNVRIIALLAGILMIGQIGGSMVRSALYPRRRLGRFSRRRLRTGRNIVIRGLIGLALLAIGYGGVFFGRVIQAAVSRQREVLADASSVQFTRNPEGIAGALFKIGRNGSYLDTTSHASDMNHMCFGESVRVTFTKLLASHPPVKERINAIQPGMMTRLRSRLRDTEPSAGPRTALNAEPNTAPNPQPAFAPEGSSGLARPFSDQVGTINRQSEEFALRFLEQLPATFRNLLYTRTGAVQLCYALLINGLPQPEQTERLGLLPDHPVLGGQPELLRKLLPALETIGDGVHFPALELAMPALRKLEPEERQTLIANIQTLVAADNRVTLFELTLTSFLYRHLDNKAARVVPVRYKNYEAVMPALKRVLSLMAKAGTATRADADALYRSAMASFASTPDGVGSVLEQITLRQLREALTTLNGLSPLLKPAVIDACQHCITHDGKTETREYELMRLVADQMDCPMPPLAA